MKCAVAAVSLLSLLAGFLPTSSALECATGLGTQLQAIPDEWLNDGYCDCPLDGADEPGTNACSGSHNWPGIVAVEEAIRYVVVLRTSGQDQ